MQNHDDEPSDIFKTNVSAVTSFEIPGFRIIGELGRGAFGVVYRAYDDTLDRQVAIKVALVDDTARRDEYIQEAQKAAKLTIDGVVPVYQVGRLNTGMPFVVQMLLEGGTLRQEMKRAGGIAPKRVCELMIRVAQVVAQAHAVGLIHRDLKPDNILLDSRGQPWVADFGLALSESEQRLHKGEKAGTPLYMSPEQILGRAEWLDGRADIYALGIIFYELLVGRPPFTARTRHELEEEILHRDPKPLSQYLTGIPHEFDLIFSKCCAKQTNDRYANAMDLMLDLQEVHRSINYGEVQYIGSARSSQMHASSRLAGRSTLRNSIYATSREQLPERKAAFPVWIAATTAVFIVAGLFLYFNRHSLPFGANNSAAKGDVSSNPPSRPDKLRVSQDKDSPLKSIAEAIRLARRGEQVFIGAGKYEESLVLTQDVELIGDGDGRPSIYTLSGDTLSIENGARVVLKNLQLDSSGKNANTIHVKQGGVQVENCTIFATSFNCVRAVANCSVQLTGATLLNGAHEAIYVEGVKTFEIDRCIFRINFGITPDADQHPYGVQALRCAGRISGCTFEGRGQRGVFWKDATGPIVLENNKFSAYDFPIELHNIHQATIQGETTMVACKHGIELRDSNVAIRGLRIEGDGKSQTAGIRIAQTKDKPDTNPKRITIDDSVVEKFEQGLDIRDKTVELKLQNVTFTGNESSLNFEEARSATLNQCAISQGIAGILISDCAVEVIDCQFKALRSGILVNAPFDDRKSLRCAQSRFSGPEAIGLILKSGWVELDEPNMEAMDAAVVLEKSSMDAIKRKLEVKSLKSTSENALRAKAPGEVTVTGCELRMEASAGLKVKESGDSFSFIPKTESP